MNTLREARLFPEGLVSYAFVTLDEFYHASGVRLLVAVRKAIAVIGVLAIRHFLYY